MFSVIACIRDDHDFRLILVAAVICLIGSLATMLLFSRAQECQSHQRRYWIAAAAFASGIGIWATHFIAMLAYQSSLPIYYGLSLTVLSVVLAIIGSWLAVAIAFEWDNGVSFAVGGILMAFGIGAMHFSGMQAIEASAELSYDLQRVVISIAVGAVFSSLAFLAFRSLHGLRRIIAGAFLLLLAICSLHFTAMSGVTLTPEADIFATIVSIDRSILAGIVMAAATCLILIALGAIFIDRHLTDLRGFVNASLEGLLIVRDGRIIDANERFFAISGWSAQQVTGVAPEAFLTLDMEAHADAAIPLETTLSGSDGKSIPVETVRRSITYRGHECSVLVVRDLTERRQAQQMIEHLAHHDILTDLPNRSLFDQRMRQALQVADRKGGEVAVFCLDLDRFKAINDVFGHAEGDRILCKVAGILQHIIEEGDTVARLGGDEFAIIQPKRQQPAGATRLAERILAEFAMEMDMARDPTAVGVSLGIAIYPRDGASAEQLYANADTALYRAKRAGRGHACFFDAEMDKAVRMRRQLENDLRQAILRRQLFLEYQPIYDVGSDSVSGYEALLRWAHPDRGLIDPETFIPIAEESGSIVAIGEWVLQQACQEAMRWSEPANVAVNLSPLQFMIPTLYDQIEGILRRTGLEPRRLELEITEAALMRERAVVIATLQRLHRLGVRVVMDDFGTGFSSLSNLRAFPFDKIKVDRSFTGALEHDPAARSIVRAIIGLGHSLNMPVVTEGVETETQRRIVIEEGCAQLQGIFFGKPDVGPSQHHAVLVKAVGQS
ncbi:MULTISPECIES: EAL domain-containing protein [Rhizobium]|uniref:Bifunctional diguanylate cyclase/phosphodiesterase n=1 Tax=Rhizobium tropici TaxID=398 RepID=A0A329YGW1_RHITR|nr:MULTISPECIES: EAL domain-containing protein [Rhizobium]MBB3290833.1 diguanylate cyclase (GGDEF)-like protein/PAS domain S-box-containing protein [Rhizobium sp. BK252]MBB3405613.1 diguanylate cyclase (GGDEF)-like protein/PAS domain S-box-containing protein [Rhizobium sp. BK289]MBB3418097.1 diguanylate cyclase (GGDEF)-like protein/PAS domain S-box-containing protein [Rhizobium sp. BK284]MBB3485976.1 diguanylate cyclase (GGDEF)-like protein/PAS domain S-box-containing protein [Rhizobium sp. BK3